MENFTTSQLISDIKRRASVPTNQSLMSDSDLCAFLTDCQKLYLIPLFMQTREEFFVYTTETPYIVGQTEYSLPIRAVANKLRNLSIVDSAGNTRYLPRIAPENNINSGLWNSTNYGKSGYYFKNNKIVLAANTQLSAGDSLVLDYFRRPSRLVPITSAGKITNIIGNIVTIDNIPSTWSADILLDAYNQNTPFDALAEDFQPSAIIGFDLTLSPATVATLSIGDYISEAGETVIPQFPLEAHPYLVQYCVIKMLDAIGDQAGMQRAMADFKVIEANLLTLLDNRDEGNPQKVVSNTSLWNN